MKGSSMKQTRPKIGRLAPGGTLALIVLTLSACGGGSDGGGTEPGSTASDDMPGLGTPPVNTESEAPENPFEEPGTGTPTEGPGTETPGEEPGTGTPTEGPGTETPDEEPGTGTPTEEPGTETPGEELGTGTPTEGPGTETPGEEPGTGTPTEEPGTDEPGMEAPDEEPGTGTSTEEPGMESPPETSDAVVTVENRDTVLANLLNVVDGGVFDEIHSLGDALLNADEGRVTRVGSESDRTSETETYTCSGGGSYVTRSATSGVIGIILNGTATACVVAEGRLDGSLGRGGNLYSVLEAFSLTRSSDDTARVASSYRTTGRDVTDPARTMEGSFDVSDFTDGEVAIDATTDLSYVDLSAVDASSPDAPRFYARFMATVTAPWTGGQPLEIETSTGFEAAVGEANYPVGTLVARAADGSSLTLDAANGDPDTFQITVETQGTTSSFTVSWSDGTRLPLATP